MFFGNNAYGVKAAAQEYFGKDLDRPHHRRGGGPAGPDPQPLPLRPAHATSEIPSRARDAVIDKMVEEGYITAAEGADGQGGSRSRWSPIEEFPDLAPQVLIAAKDTILNDARYGLGATYLQRKRALFGCPADDTECEGGGGLKIYTTVDFGLQEEAREILQEWFPPGANGPPAPSPWSTTAPGPPWSWPPASSSAPTSRPASASTTWPPRAGATRVRAFKPFGLVAALEQGIPLNSYWDYDHAAGPRLRGHRTLGVQQRRRATSRGSAPSRRRSICSTNTVFCQVVDHGRRRTSIVEVAHRMGIKSPLGDVPVHRARRLRR